MGDYAATSEAEFFAVAAERFFTQPALLRQYHPPIYELLAEYNGVQPINWFRTQEANP